MSPLFRMDAETLPRTLVFTPPLTETEFEVLCRESDNIRFERTKDGTICMNPPAGGWTSDGNAEIIPPLALRRKHPHRKPRDRDVGNEPQRVRPTFKDQKVAAAASARMGPAQIDKDFTPPVAGQVNFSGGIVH